MNSSLIFLVPLALVLGGLALWAFLWSFRAGQYDDMEGAAARILLDEDEDDRPAAADDAPTSPDREPR